MDYISGVTLLLIVFFLLSPTTISVWGACTYIGALRGIKKSDKEIARDKLQKKFEEVFRGVPRE